MRCSTLRPRVFRLQPPLYTSAEQLCMCSLVFLHTQQHLVRTIVLLEAAAAQHASADTGHSSQTGTPPTFGRALRAACMTSTPAKTQKVCAWLQGPRPAGSCCASPGPAQPARLACAECELLSGDQGNEAQAHEDKEQETIDSGTPLVVQERGQSPAVQGQQQGPTATEDRPARAGVEQRIAISPAPLCVTAGMRGAGAMHNAM